MIIPKNFHANSPEEVTQKTEDVLRPFPGAGVERNVVANPLGGYDVFLLIEADAMNPVPNGKQSKIQRRG